jgi:hypothetical protein
MDPDTTLERLAMLSLDDKATADDNKKKEEENKQDKEAPGEMPRPKNTWRRTPREVHKTTDKQEEQVEQAEDKKRLPERAWEEEGNYNSYQEEHEAKWPRWRGYNTEKGTFTRHWEQTRDHSQTEEDVQHQSRSSSSNQVITPQNQQDNMGIGTRTECGSGIMASGGSSSKDWILAQVAGVKKGAKHTRSVHM